MALYIPHSIFHLARLLYVRPETFGPYYVLTMQLVTALLDYTRRREVMDAISNNGKNLGCFISFKNGSPTGIVRSQGACTLE